MNPNLASLLKILGGSTCGNTTGVPLSQLGSSLANLSQKDVDEFNLAYVLRSDHVQMLDDKEK